MEVYALIDEADIGQIRIDQQASFTVGASPDRTFSATVTEIRRAPSSSGNVVTYTAILAATNPDFVLLPGMTATLQIVVDQVQDGYLRPTPKRDNIMRYRYCKYLIFREMYFVVITLGLAAPIARFTS
jgi:multidrug efflux pump subunit AcrA (membrane-fusion protein)